MLCIVQISLTLLTIVAGMFLLAKVQKDNLNNLYKAIAYGVIVVGFITFICAVGCSLCSSRCYKGGGKNCMMYNGCDQGGGSCGMMNQMNNCGNGMMMGCRHGMGMGMQNCEMKCRKSNESNCHYEEDDDENEDAEDAKEATPVKPEANAPK